MAHAANHLGRVRLHPGGVHEVLEGIDPVASEDPMAFLPYDREVAAPGPRRSVDNAYPYAAERILSLFADPTRSPDLAVVHTPRHWFPDEGGHVGRARLARRHPVPGAAGPQRGRGRPARARRRPRPPRRRRPDPRDAGRRARARRCATRQVPALDGAPLTSYLQEAARLRAPRVVGILWDGAHCGDLLHLAEAGELPACAG